STYERCAARHQVQVIMQDAGVDGEEDKDGHQYQGERDLRGEIDPQPDDEERGQDDAGYCIEEDHHRLEEVGDDGGEGRGEAEGDTENDPAAEADRRGEEGCRGGRAERASGEEAHEHRNHAGGRGGVEGIDDAGARCDFPECHEGEQSEHAPDRTAAGDAGHAGSPAGVEASESSSQRRRRSVSNSGWRRDSRTSRGRGIATSWRALMRAPGPCESTYTASDTPIASSRSWVTSSTLIPSRSTHPSSSCVKRVRTIASRD